MVASKFGSICKNLKLSKTSLRDISIFLTKPGNEQLIDHLLDAEWIKNQKKLILTSFLQRLQLDTK